MEGMDIDTRCLLYGGEIKIVENVFYTCAYTKWIMGEMLEAIGGMIKLPTSPLFTSMANAINAITKGTKLWGLSWMYWRLFHGGYGKSATTS